MDQYILCCDLYLLLVLSASGQLEHVFATMMAGLVDTLAETYWFTFWSNIRAYVHIHCFRNNNAY